MISDPFLLGEEIAVTGSPNTVKSVHFDVRQDFLDAPLLGSLVAFEMRANVPGRERRILVVGQVGDATTRNRWHEDEGFKDYLKRKGSLPHLTGAADVTTGSMQVLGAYERDPDTGAWRKATLTVPCGSGKSVMRVDERVVRALMAGERGYAFAGTFYGSPGVPAPVFSRHFGSSSEGGQGEALIGGVFGPSGSGKTVLGLSLATLWARHEPMGLLFLDPQGELASDQVGGGTGFDYAFHRQLEVASAGRFKGRGGSDVLSIANVRLEGVELFVSILIAKGYLGRAGVGPAKADLVKDALANDLGEMDGEPDKWRPHMSWDEASKLEVETVDYDEEGGDTPVSRPFPEWLCQTMASCYAGGSRAEKLKDFRAKARTSYLRKAWDETAELFRDSPGRKALSSLVDEVLTGRQIRILDLNPQVLSLPDSLRNDIVLLVFQKISQVANRLYRAGKASNALVVLDEAAVYIPRQTDDKRVEKIADDLAAKAKMLRKLGVGMMFMTQRISGIREDVFSQMHFRAYGQGLNVAGDARAIKDREGTEAFDLYDALPDPRLTGEFSFMVAGSLVAMGSSGQPMFVTGFRDGASLMAANKSFFRPYNASVSTSSRRLGGALEAFAAKGEPVGGSD